jgi:hypothetical protein
MFKQFWVPSSINIFMHAVVAIMKKIISQKKPSEEDLGGIEIPNNLTGARGIYICTEITAGKINKKNSVTEDDRRKIGESKWLNEHGLFHTDSRRLLEARGRWMLQARGRWM